MKREKEFRDFMAYAYLSIKPEDWGDYSIIQQKCANKAYLDLCRTLKFNDDLKDNLPNKIKKEKEEYRKEFRNYICKMIICSINKYFLTQEKPYNEWHKELCDKIIGNAKIYPLTKKVKEKKSCLKKIKKQKNLFVMVKLKNGLI